MNSITVQITLIIFLLFCCYVQHLDIKLLKHKNSLIEAEFIQIIEVIENIQLLQIIQNDILEKIVKERN